MLYLIESIVKNAGDVYTSLFTQNIVSTFCGVFEKVLHIFIFVKCETLQQCEEIIANKVIKCETPQHCYN